MATTLITSAHSPYLVSPHDRVIAVDTSGGQVNLRLPAIGQVNPGDLFTFAIVGGSNSVVITTEDSSGISGANSAALSHSPSTMLLQALGVGPGSPSFHQWLVVYQS